MSSSSTLARTAALTRALRPPERSLRVRRGGVGCGDAGMILLVMATAGCLYLSSVPQSPMATNVRLSCRGGTMDTTDHRAVAICLEQIGVTAPTWKTLVVSAGAIADKPADRLWTTWSDVRRWPEWSTPLHVAVRWVDGDSFAPGAKFEQVIQLGFPVGRITSLETVGMTESGRYVSWSKRASGMRSCHRWQFEPLPDGRTRVSNVEVFHGTPVGLIKPLVGKRWRVLFQTSVDNLIAAA